MTMQMLSWAIHRHTGGLESVASPVLVEHDIHRHTGGLEIGVGLKFLF